MGSTSAIVHHIDTGSHAPLRKPPYRVSHPERYVTDDQVVDMLQRGVIEPSNSPWASLVYRRLNKATRKDVYPLPRIDVAFDCLQEAEFFSSLDFRYGYWQVPTNDADSSKTAFVMPDRLQKFNVMPFGLCNVPVTFDRFMDNILRGFKWNTCLCYLGEVILFSNDNDSHLSCLANVLACTVKPR